jgi:hypothetical protein
MGNRQGIRLVAMLPVLQRPNLLIFGQTLGRLAS